MKQWCSAFATDYRPEVRGQAYWPAFTAKSGLTLLLRPGAASMVIDNRRYNAQYQCGF